MNRSSRAALATALVGVLVTGCGGSAGGGGGGGLQISGSVTGAVRGGVTVAVAGAGSGSATTDGDGRYTVAGLTSGSYTVTPALIGYTFSPPSRTVSLGAADVTAVDFQASVAAQGSPAQLHAAAASACAGMRLRSTGTRHYFCACETGAETGCGANAGNDAWDGLYPDHSLGGVHGPRASWAQVVSTFNAMPGGDTVALCKGGAWSTSTVARFANARCAAAADMRAAASEAPCDLRDYSPPGVTAKPLVRQTGEANLLSFEGITQGGIRILNLDLEGGGGGPGGTDVGQRAIALDDANSGFLICNNTLNGWYHGIHVNVTTAASHIDVWGNRILMSSTEGILGAGSHSTFDANFMDNNGGGTAHGGHVIYAGGEGIVDFSIVNNEIRRSAGPACPGAILVVHDSFDGFRLENNIIDGGSGAGVSCYGIQIDDGGYPRVAYYRNLVIRRNWLQNAGTAPIGVAEAPGAVIENNIIVSGYPYTWGITAPSVRHRSEHGDDVSDGIVVRNNTVYLLAGATNSQAITVGLEGTGHVIANNVAWFAGGGGACFVTPLDAAAYAYVGTNACNGDWSTTLDTTTHVTGNALFTSAPTDFTPATGSSLLGAGSAARAPEVDFLNAARPTPPSIGALEGHR